MPRWGVRAALLAVLVLGAAGPADVAAVSTWVVQPTADPSSSSPRADAFSSVACPSTTECFAVGNQSNGSGVALTLAEHWNGATWSVQATPNPIGATSSVLLGIACSGTASFTCEAVGDSFKSSGVEVPLAERWNGTSWSLQAAPAPSNASAAMLNGVSCTGASQCEAVGSSFNGAGSQLSLAEVWNGTSWAIQSTLNPSGALSSTLSGVGCASATFCEAAGNYLTSAGKQLPLAERWNGSSWTLEKPANPSSALGSALLAVSCPATTSCTAVGYADKSSRNVLLVEQWSNSAWAVQLTGTVWTGLAGVSCPQTTSCKAVGAMSDVPLAEAWNGSSWSGQTTENRGNNGSALSGVSCASVAPVCTAAGWYLDGTHDLLTLAERSS
ncbi:MAG: hypothetical protein E6J45_05695 [Chloroflexi bacterium]|nr:MAG: hypothetical protein E6J45_05695 [Chloroflexota bacterium]